MRTSGRLRNARLPAGLALHYAVLFLPFGLALWWLVEEGVAELAGKPWQALVLAGGIYLASHCVRAVRLAIMASRLLGISGRSSALLHMVTSPGALVIPFKLGEILRLHQLWYLGKSFPGALIIILLERFFDGLMILALLGIVYAYHGPLATGPMVLLAVTSVAVLAGLVVFVLGPGILRAVQHYVVLNHRNPNSLRHLGQLDGLRQITTRGADLFRVQGPVLLVMSMVIWGLEALAATVLALTSANFVGTSGIVLLAERVFEGPVASFQGAVGTWSSLCLLSLALVWPLAMWIYLPRVRNEPLRAQNRTGVL
ncbi:lysylphosphatidylglycerol synthase domain-containing protein [Roseibium aggregatum]|uniref:lysylphosphatidylglycerol synthase domain-containing protein n=1 Tax=Roseibium aggregatum TaxID=187304 RepID=UPI0012F4F5E0|nr:lysylphosphatidylglycerol synthase domain-containing protein [Roseibium aggregatum]